MKALQLSEYGGPESLRLVDVPQPVPAKREVLIKVEAGGLNYSDIMISHNRYLETMPLPYIMGREFVGEVVAAGEGVDDEMVGARVVGSARGGAFAEYVTANFRALRPIPDFLGAGEAIALQVQGLTAVHCLHDVARLQAGERVLVHAAAGGVGTLAVQLAKLHGAREVYGTASSQAKCDLIEELGGIGINYKDDDWVAVLKAHTNNNGVDVILESVGGDVFTRSFREALADFGRLVVFGAASQDVRKLTNVEILASGKSIHGYFLPQFYKPGKVQRVIEAWHHLLVLAEAEQLRVIVGAAFSLEDSLAAFAHMQGRGSVGKVLIKP